MSDPAPGWYADPNNPGRQRYWNGTQWTASVSGSSERKASTALVVIAYITALLLPIVGFILGIVLLVRRQTGHGLACVLLSIAVGIAACSIAVNSANNDLDSYAKCINNADTVAEMNRCS